MPTQLALLFDEVPITCEVQRRYHAIAPCIAGVSTPAEQAQALNLGYSTITRWLREFRENGMVGLFPASQYPREPYTPERVIVQLLFFKCCAPKAGDRELARVIYHLNYLDAKPAGVQLYSTLLLEGLSRTILAGSLTTEQEVGVILHVYFLALLRWGLWESVVSDHGGQFISNDFRRVNKRLGIHHELYEKGKPWRNLIESQFGIQARLGEYHWQRCKTIEEAVEFHRDLIRDHNRLPPWVHHRRNDGKKSPLEVLNDARGKEIEPIDLQRAFGQRYCQRMTDARGFICIGRWKIYIEEALPRTHVQLSFWDGRLRAEYQSQILAEYRCKWGKKSARPTAISQPIHHDHPFQSRQMMLFDPLWIRDPMDLATESLQRSEKKQPSAEIVETVTGS
jgi:Winged helix-turn helix